MKLRHPKRKKSKPYILELFSNIDWASCKGADEVPVQASFLQLMPDSQRFTVLDFSFFEFHGSKDSAATNLFTEAIYLKQVPQFLWAILVALATGKR